MALFESMLQKLSIEHHLIKPRTPQHNGKIERFHKSLPNESGIEKYEACSNEKINAQLQQYLKWYNEVRPHSSIRYLTPKQVYENSYLTEAV